MLKVFTGPELARAIKATTVEESAPPLRKAPKGTSEIRRMCVASKSGVPTLRDILLRSWGSTYRRRERPNTVGSGFCRQKFEKVTRGKLVNSGKGGEGIGNISEVEIFEKSLRINVGEIRGDGEKGFNFRTEVKLPLCSA